MGINRSRNHRMRSFRWVPSEVIIRLPLHSNDKRLHRAFGRVGFSTHLSDSAVVSVEAAALQFVPVAL